MKAVDIHCACGVAIPAPESTEWKQSKCPCGAHHWTRWSKSKPFAFYVDGPWDTERWKNAPQRKEET